MMSESSLSLKELTIWYLNTKDQIVDVFSKALYHKGLGRSVWPINLREAIMKIP